MDTKSSSKRLSPSASRQLAFVSEEDATSFAQEFREIMTRVIEAAYTRYVSTHSVDEDAKTSSMLSNPLIQNQDHVIERIRALFIYMKHREFITHKEKIIELLAQQHAFLNALFEGQEDIDDSFETLALEIRKFLNAHAIQTVTPFQFQAKIQRRLDSLARILTPYARFTVCVALTIVGNRLFISANHHGSETTLCANHIWNKLTLFREFFYRLPVRYYQLETFDAYQRELTDEINGFLPLLSAQGGNYFSDTILAQAVQKSIFACANPVTHDALGLVERESFTLNERNAILDNKLVTLLVPKKQAGQELQRFKTLCYSEFQINQEDASAEGQLMMERIHTLGKFHPNLSIKYIHCEHLLIYFLEKIRATLSPRSHTEIGLLRLGISKLCCQTCIIAIDEWNKKRAGHMQVAVRGWHETTYELVLNLFDPQPFSQYQRISEFSEGDELSSAPISEQFIFQNPKTLDSAFASAPQSPVKSSSKRPGEELEAVATPKRLDVGAEKKSGRNLFGCGKALASPNTPYDPVSSKISGLELHLPSEFLKANPLVFPTSLMSNELNEDKSEVCTNFASSASPI